MLKWEVENPGDISFLENKANELRDLAEDEWNILKKDVANSMRNLTDGNLKEK